MNAQPPLDQIDQLGPLLSAKDMARIWAVTPSQFYRLARLGKFDRFKVQPPVGPRCYSKQLVVRYLAGEPIEPVTSRVFGRKRVG